MDHVFTFPFKARPVRMAWSTQCALSTGRVPGTAASTNDTCELGFMPNAVEAAAKIMYVNLKVIFVDDIFSSLTWKQFALRSDLRVHFEANNDLPVPQLTFKHTVWNFDNLRAISTVERRVGRAGCVLSGDGSVGDRNFQINYFNSYLLAACKWM